ncbi:MAG: hypothetical protein WDO72_10000 [Pseudomonadota bacterium]
MDIPDFEQIGKRGFYRPSARVSFEQAVEMVAGVMREARRLELIDLLVNTKGLVGFGQPSIFARHSLAVEWARSSGPNLRVALVARPEVIDPQKIGVLMAQNRGVAGDIFTNEAEALAWLDSHLISATGTFIGLNPNLKPPP